MTLPPIIIMDGIMDGPVYVLTFPEWLELPLVLIFRIFRSAARFSRSLCSSTASPIPLIDWLKRASPTDCMNDRAKAMLLVRIVAVCSAHLILTQKVQRGRLGLLPLSILANPHGSRFERCPRFGDLADHHQIDLAGARARARAGAGAWARARKLLNFNSLVIPSESVSS